MGYYFQWGLMGNLIGAVAMPISRRFTLCFIHFLGLADVSNRYFARRNVTWRTTKETHQLCKI